MEDCVELYSGNDERALRVDRMGLSMAVLLPFSLSSSP
jgi:hypothetical protein